MSTYTTSSSFTITHARYVTSKIAADLRQLRLLYNGRPSETEIDNYAEEAALLLRDGYLERVDYGFKRKSAFGEEWVLLLRYVVRNGEIADDNSGRVPPGVALGSDTYFHSYLTYTGTFLNLPMTDRDRVKARLPIKRTPGGEAGFATGTWTGGRTYASNQRGVDRAVFRAL